MNEVNWLMVVTAAILIVASMLGYINGLIKTVLNLVLGIVTLVLVMVFSPRVCDFLQESTPIHSYIEVKAENVVRNQIQQQQQQGMDLEQLGQEAFVEGLPFLPAMKDAILENEQLKEYAAQGLEQMTLYIGDTVADLVVTLIGYFATFVVVYLALRIVAFVLDIVGKLPLIHDINKITGLAAGLIEGLLAVWILGIVLTMTATTQLGQSAAQCIEESMFLRILYGNNLLQQIFFMG